MPGRDEEHERLKKAVFDSMSERRQKHILKKGYDKWDPFLAPKDPIDIRRDATKRTTQQLIREFLQSLPQEGYSNTFAQGAFEMAIGIVNDDERLLGAYAFSVWYAELLKKHAPES